MPRKGPAPRREIALDTVYNNKLVAQLINQVLRGGKKSLAESIVYKSFDIIKERAKTDPLSVLKKAVENVRPLLGVRPRRVGGATYQVPVEVPVRRGTTLALRWIVGFACARSGKKMSERLAAELMEAAKGTGSAAKKKEDLHKMAEANRAFAHYRW
ncbi:MAG TPA: 30S ribosomal protein S7 [Actinobacteria bacterium]|nr:30S ribosomal protein S7 [Actinomycetota bacterium]